MANTVKPDVNPGDKIYKKNYYIDGNNYDIYTTPEGWTKIILQNDDSEQGFNGHPISILKMSPAEVIKKNLVLNSRNFPIGTVPLGKSIGYSVSHPDISGRRDTVDIVPQYNDVQNTIYFKENGGQIN